MKWKLLLGLLLLILISCSGSNEPADTPNGETSKIESVDEADNETLFEPDDLPGDLDFNGKTITILYREEEVKEFHMTEQTGDIVEDAVYLSNKNVEERLNVNIEVLQKLGNASSDRTNFVNFVTNSVMSGDDSFQIVAALTYNTPAFIQNNLLINLQEVPYLNFDKPWWVQALVEFGTIGDQLFLASGDASLSLIKKTFCLYFNQNLLNSLKLDTPYQMVYDNSWTFDNFSAMTKSVYTDLNGDGLEDDQDIYGFSTYDRNHMNLFIGAFDLQVTDKDDEGYPIIVFGNEKVASAVELLCDFFSNNNGITFNSVSDSGTALQNHESVRNMFTGGRLLFVSAEFNNAELYRDMSDTYGVLPLPKWDDKQDGYYTVARNIYSSFGIPKTCGDIDMSGAVLEAIASENYRTLSPVYFETALKVKYSNDTEDAKMYDIIKNGLKFNFGYTYHLIVNMTDFFVNSIHNNNSNWVSTYETNEKSSIAAVDKFIQQVIENK